MNTRVVNVRKERSDVYIGRPSKYGNQYRIGVDGDREKVVRLYRLWFFHPMQAQLREEARRELKGKRLGCYSHPLPCHGDVLAAYVDEEEKTT